MGGRVTVSLDADAARSVARSLTIIGNSLYEQAIAWRVRFDELDLTVDGIAGRRAIEESAEELWRDATFLALTADRVTAADTAPITAADLWRLAGGREGRHGRLGPFRELLGVSPAGGDVGGLFDGELRRPLHVFGADPVARSRSLVGRLLADLSDPLQIRDDEFALVQLAEDRFIVVLPGVTDLSRPDLFLSDRHRSARDLDQHAVPSSRSSAVSDNRYAELVWDALRARGVPDGSELMIVGHSFGADTALDLAADHAFNGQQYTVTHVVAAGYHSEPQLADVVDGTEVLVLQNHRDAAVIVEQVGQSNATKSVTSRAGIVTDMFRLDLPGAVGHAADAIQLDIGAMIDLGELVGDHGDEMGGVAIGVTSGNWSLAEGAAADLLTLEPRVERVGDHAIVDVFVGGSDGVGHHPSNYIEHVVEVDHPDVEAFLASVSARGFDADAAVVAVDISMPTT